MKPTYTGHKADKIKLLIADADIDNLTLAIAEGKKRGWDISCATSSGGIIDVINEECEHNSCFDAIVADIQFPSDELSGPKLSGISAARQIRKVKADIPIIFVSSVNNMLIKEEVMSVGASIIDKPQSSVGFEQLFNRIEQIVHWYRDAHLGNGTDRRRNSVNRSPFNRRKNDRILVEAPTTLRRIIQEIRKEAHAKLL